MNQVAQVQKVKLSRDRKYLVVEADGKTTFLNANLVRYLFDVPYTRRDGTYVAAEEIFDMKERAQHAYESRVRQSAG